MAKKEELDKVFYLHGFNPKRTDAVTYFLPRLISVEPMLHGAERLIHPVDLYNYEPNDLAALFAPVPKAESTGDRFFFKTQEAEPAPQQKPVSSRSQKRLAAVAADQHFLKRVRVCVPSPPVVDHRKDHSAVSAQSPAFLPAAFAGAPAAAEADDDMDRFTCALEERLDCFGARQEEETQPVLDENLGGPAPEQQPVSTSDHESFIAAEEEKYSWATLRRYKQRPIFRLDQLDGYQEFVSYTLNLDGCSSDVGIFDTKFAVDYTAVL